MSDYQPRPADIEFILSKVLGAPAYLHSLSAYTHVDAGLMQQVLEESAKFVGKVVAPLQRVGDEVGAQHTHENGTGKVNMAPGFRDAYQSFWRSGWAALACATEDGGQGLPAVLQATLYEMLSAANHGWTMAPGLLHGAYECIKHHASDTLKEQYLKKIATGEWLATMCLTEAHAGSDLGLVRTRAVAQADGSYAISGTKIFISGGEHDLSDNIVHLVLARLPAAPSGPKGLSLFLVPKFYADGTRSAAQCERIEKKMGLHGSPTCVMRFEQARGWLVGAAGKGLNAMFVMMNAARLHVALQGIGLLDAAWQKADAYSQERCQMRAPGRGKSAAEADAIAGHPAMRRILDTQRAWVDCARVLAYTTAVELDVIKHQSDAARRTQAQRWCALVTPVIKAACTHQAFYGSSACLQVFGGHGYMREWGIEQIVRDSRVTMIYEGTNEIQAIDLLVRKVLCDGGASLFVLLDELATQLPAGLEASAAVQQRLAQLRTLTEALVLAAKDDATLAYWVADDYLRLVAMTLLGWAGARIEATAQSAPDAHRWSLPQSALKRWVLPEFAMRLAIIKAALAANPAPATQR